MSLRLEANDKVYIMGEEVAQYNGAYKVTKVGQYKCTALEMIF